MFLFFKFYFFDCAGSSLLHGLRLVVESGAALQCRVPASHCGGFSCGAWAVGCRLNSRVAWPLLLCGMWDLPGSGIKPVSPALAGRFFTTEPPGNP